MPKMNTVEYANHRGVTKQSVGKAIATGRISATKDDKGWIVIDSEIADQQWDANTDDARRPLLERSGVIDAVDLDDDLASTGEPANPSPAQQATIAASKRYVDARAERERYQASTAKMDYQRKSGQLARVDEVEAEAFRTARMIRDAMLNIPDRISHELAAMSDAGKIHFHLTGAIKAALDDLIKGEGGEVDAQETKDSQGT